MQRSCDPAINSFQTTNESIHGPGGDQVMELNTQYGTTSAPLGWAHSNVFSAARLTAIYDTSGLHFELADFPGSPRARGPQRAISARWGVGTGLRPWGGSLGTKRVQTNIYGQIEMSWVSLPFGDALTPIVPKRAPSTSVSIEAKTS
ncbi:MAG TPA: hypothetical protein VGE85_10250 [Terracidiphilus sp.]|jgi:hypothetical protein